MEGGMTAEDYFPPPRVVGRDARWGEVVLSGHAALHHR